MTVRETCREREVREAEERIAEANRLRQAGHSERADALMRRAREDSDE
jgi:hypothetical protein